MNRDEFTKDLQELINALGDDISQNIQEQYENEIEYLKKEIEYLKKVQSKQDKFMEGLRKLLIDSNSVDNGFNSENAPRNFKRHQEISRKTKTDIDIIEKEKNGVRDE